MPKPGGCHSSGISLGDVLRLPKRHPAWRRREAQSGSCMERENLAGDAKGKGTSGSNREVESTDAPERGGLPRRCPRSEGGRPSLVLNRMTSPASKSRSFSLLGKTQFIVPIKPQVCSSAFPFLSRPQNTGSLVLGLRPIAGQCR